MRPQKIKRIFGAWKEESLKIAILQSYDGALFSYKYSTVSRFVNIFWKPYLAGHHLLRTLQQGFYPRCIHHGSDLENTEIGGEEEISVPSLYEVLGESYSGRGCVGGKRVTIKPAQSGIGTDPEKSKVILTDRFCKLDRQSFIKAKFMDFKPLRVRKGE